jgi:hypothetical protein
VAAGEVLAPLSLTVTLKLLALVPAVVGIPLITPVAGFNVSPAGSDPELTVQLL